MSKINSATTPVPRRITLCNVRLSRDLLSLIAYGRALTMQQASKIAIIPLKYFAYGAVAVSLSSSSVNGWPDARAKVEVSIIRKITPNRQTVVSIVNGVDTYILRSVAVSQNIAYPTTYVA